METLRAMRERSKKPKLAAAGIMDESFLTSIAPGTPFHVGTELGTIEHAQAVLATLRIGAGTWREFGARKRLHGR
jgi:hypothetical protein